MSRQYKENQTQDPFHSILDGFFKGLWYLIAFPFKDKRKAAEFKKTKTEFRNHWANIEAMITASQWREAIMNADMLLDKALRLKNLPGVTLGERLKNADQVIPKDTLDTAWRAHKVRNRLAHELHYEPTEVEAKQVMADFKRVLREMGLL